MDSQIFAFNIQVSLLQMGLFHKISAQQHNNKYWEENFEVQQMAIRAAILFN